MGEKKFEILFASGQKKVFHQDTPKVTAKWYGSMINARVNMGLEKDRVLSIKRI